MKVAISQPTYLPWLGYFDVIDQVDKFVFLDNVQFEKRSWQQRNRIKGPNGFILLTVPVAVKGRFDQKIDEAAISEPELWTKHCRSIEMNYRNARFFSKYWETFCHALATGWRTGRLVDLNIALVRWCMQALGMEKPLIRCSDIASTGKKGELLASTCECLGADSYLSARGSAEYLMAEEGEFTRRGIQVTFQHYEHPRYMQQFPPFIPYASVIDLLFNQGQEAIAVLRAGRRESFSLEQLRHEYATRAES
jgi:WbqC-like protein